MATTAPPVAETEVSHSLATHAYRVLGYFGLLSIFGTILYGFRYAPSAPARNYLLDLALYVAFVTPHLVMTRGWFKRALMGDPAGSPAERRVYIMVTLVTWLPLVIFHLPLSGVALVPSGSPLSGIEVPLEVLDLLRFLGCVGFLFAFLLFFEGTTFAKIDGLLGVPGAVKAYSHGPDTPLVTEGQYAQVRHPMYRAALLAGVCTWLIHPNLAQVFWTGMIGATFLGFIPIEEAQMIAARGDDYRQYQRRTPWRLMRGVW